MSTVEQIESAILGLGPEDFRRLAEWLADVDQRRWDEQLERDVAAGLLDEFATEAITDHEAGRSREI